MEATRYIVYNSQCEYPARLSLEQTSKLGMSIKLDFDLHHSAVFCTCLTSCQVTDHLPNLTPSLSSTGVKLALAFQRPSTPKAFQQLLFKEHQVAIAVHHLVSAPIAAGKHPL